ncbi:hypothetical protein ACFFRR_010103 [Megaselia abdita]
MKSLCLLSLLVGIASCIPVQITKNPNLFEGDMILTPEQKEWLFSTSESRNGVTSPLLRWPGGVVYYRMDSSISSSQQQLIRNSLAKISQVTCLRFLEGSNPQGHYIRVTNSASGCFSYVGYLRTVQQLNIGRGCEWEHIIIHEFLHAVGFHHQQCSFERDDYVEIHLENVDANQKHNFDKYTNSQVTNYGTRYDYNSVMHYEANAFSKNGRPTMVAKFPEGANMGKATKMSQTDILKINKMYQC